MSEQYNSYREAKRIKRRARTIRNITVFALLMLILVGLFVIKFARKQRYRQQSKRYRNDRAIKERRNYAKDKPT